MTALITDHDQDTISMDLSGATVSAVSVNDIAATWYLGPGKLWVKLPEGPELDAIHVDVQFTGSAATTDTMKKLGQPMASTITPEAGPT